MGFLFNKQYIIFNSKGLNNKRKTSTKKQDNKIRVGKALDFIRNLDRVVKRHHLPKRDIQFLTSLGLKIKKN
jgi:hypothetical protein